VLFDANLSNEIHVSSIYKTTFFHIKNIPTLRHMFSMTNAEKLVHAFMTSRLDYCNYKIILLYWARTLNTQTPYGPKRSSSSSF